MENSRFAIKRLFFWVVALAPLLALAEICAYVLTVNCVPSRIRTRLGHSTAEFYARLPQDPTPVRAHVLAAGGRPETAGESATAGLVMFHPVLGWDYPPNLVYEASDGTIQTYGPGGERRTCTSFPTTAIATYGDSFTQCAEVADDQTWQTFLAQRLKTNVLNFGVGGYGTDQAFLKFYLHGQQRGQVVMLCILPENINRVVNIYRPFYNYQEPLALTKPRFMRYGDGFKLFPNPSSEVGSLIRLQDPEYLKQLGALDYWYQFDQELPKTSFPYLAAINKWGPHIVSHLSLLTARVAPGIYQPEYPGNLFDQPEPLGIMCHIVDLFVENARERGATPIVVILPHKDFVQEVLDYGVPRTARLLKYLEDKNYPFLDVVQAMAARKPSRETLDRWYTGHATKEGNEVTADIVFHYLREKEPMTAPDTTTLPTDNGAPVEKPSQENAFPHNLRVKAR